MKGLASLIKTETRVAEPIVLEKKLEDKIVVEEKKTVPVVDDKKSEINVPENNNVDSSTEKKYTDEDFDNYSEAKASMDAFLMSAPLSFFNGVRTRIRIGKLKKKIKDPVERQKQIDSLKKTYEANKEVIEVTDDEFKYLKRAHEAIARLNNSVAIDGQKMLAVGIMGMVISRGEILFDIE